MATKTKATHGGARRASGRKPLSDQYETVTLTVRVTSLQKWKYQKAGGADWFRAKLDAIKED